MNKALLSGLLGGLVVALALSRPSHAEGPPKAVPIVVGAKPRVHAIVVGVSDYSDKQIKARPRAEKDANDLAKLLADKAYLGADVKLLLGKPGGGAEKATRANLLKALKTVVEDARPDDLVVFAFVGEGGPIGDSGDRRCYFLADSTFKGRDKDAVAAEEIEEALKKLKAKNLASSSTSISPASRPIRPVAAPEPTLGKAPYKEFLGDDGTRRPPAEARPHRLPGDQRPDALARPEGPRPVHDGPAGGAQGQGRQARATKPTAWSPSMRWPAT